MSLLVLDASVLIAAEDIDDPEHASAVALLVGPDPLATLDLAYYEVANVALRAWRDRAAADRLIATVAAIADDGLLIAAGPGLLAACAAVADRFGIAAYDAAFVAGAQAVGAALVSCDVRDLVANGLASLPSKVVRRDN